MDGISRFSLICTAVLACSAPGISSAQDFLNDSAPPIQLPDFTDVLAGREEVVIEQRIAPAPPATPGLRTAEHLEPESVPETAEPSEPALLETVSHEQIFSWPVIETCDGDGRFGGSTDAYGCDPAGYRFQWTPDKWAKVGAAVRASFNSQNDKNQGGGGNYFTVDNARLLTSGQVTKYVGFELNSDISLANGATPANLRLPSSIDLLDAVAKFETGGVVNFWAGQFLPPSDRSNIDGPFFINGWDFPFVSNYPAIFEGRQIGAAYWGQIQEGRLKWSVGAFDGTGATLQSPFSAPLDVPPNLQGNIQFDGRVTLNLLDPEPGYYHQSSYYGAKDILAIGYAIQMQHHATGTDADPHDFLGMNIDALFEKKLPNNGVFTLEGAVYRYDDQDLTTSGRQGTSGFVYCGYLIPYVLDLGPAAGRFRPYCRYQQYNYDYVLAAAGQYDQGVDVGTEYVLNGPNARLTAVWSQRDIVLGNRVQIFRIGAQVIF
jgi:hypothetical protein